MADSARLLARGPWSPSQVEARWHDEQYAPAPRLDAEADEAVAALAERGSPCHDGVAGRLADFATAPGRLELQLQPARWALRLVEADASRSMTALCVVRREDGAWLAGRRAGWLSSWPGRWALGAGGAVDLGESPARTLGRELSEEWGLEPERLRVEALLELPGSLAMLVGVATVPVGAEPVPDAEHDAYQWWPAEVERWPAQASDRLRGMGAFLSSAA